MFLAGGQRIGFCDGVLYERTASRGLDLADLLSPNPFHLRRAVPGQLGSPVDALTALA